MEGALARARATALAMRLPRAPRLAGLPAPVVTVHRYRTDRRPATRRRRRLGSRRRHGHGRRPGAPHTMSMRLSRAPRLAMCARCVRLGLTATLCPAQELKGALGPRGDGERFLLIASITTSTGAVEFDWDRVMMTTDIKCFTQNLMPGGAAWPLSSPCVQVHPRLVRFETV